MFVIIDTQESPVLLKHPIDNTCGNLTVALLEMFYKVRWFNISETKQNNWIKKIDEHGNAISILNIPDGYYGFCTLKEMLDEHGISLKLNDANIKVALTFTLEDDRPTTYNFAGGLAKMLGFKTNNQVIHSFLVTGERFVYKGENPINLTLTSLLFVQLDELNTNENLYDGQPSTILRAIHHRESAAYCDHEIKTFSSLQFKKLTLGHHESLSLKITDQKGKKVQCDDLHVVLEIK